MNANIQVNPPTKTDVLIIGGGLAGLSAALALPKSLSIIVLTKAALETCSSHYAQGGIAASLAKEDSIDDHVADTLIAGAGLCAADNTYHILSAGQQAVQWLCAQGVPFTQTSLFNATNHLIHNSNDTAAVTAAGTVAVSKAVTELKTADLHLTQEGGHGCRRVAHAEDATGRYIMQTLIAQVALSTNITVLPYHEALTLLTEPSIHTSFQNPYQERQCHGAIVFNHTTQRQRTFHSRAVVMASGGLGKLFKRASAPDVCVGDGVMMAWQAGCRLANLEFIQFHPTGLVLGDSGFLISEALRGEGGRLYCPVTAKRFMLDIDSRAELAPRDIVARAIAEQINDNGLGYVHLDVSHLPADFLRSHFPQIYQTLLDLGVDITTDPIPVAPTAHYSCGGIVTCAEGLSDVKGLYAAGEVAYTGLHGANRLASNSLLECVVVGRNIAAHIPKYLMTGTWTPPHLIATQTVMLADADVFLTNAKHNLLKAQQVKCFDIRSNAVHTDINSDTVIDTANIATQLKAIMTTHIGIIRSAKMLEQALATVTQWQYQVHMASLDNTDGASDTLAQWQLLTQLQLAAMIIQSAYQRCESRGGHARQDYPDSATTALVSVIEPSARVRHSLNIARQPTMHPIFIEQFIEQFAEQQAHTSPATRV